MNGDSNLRGPSDVAQGRCFRRELLAMERRRRPGTLLALAAAGAGDDDGRRDRLLIRDGVVLTLDRRLGDFERGDVLVEGETIAGRRAHVPVPRRPGDRCLGMIVMPASSIPIATCGRVCSGISVPTIYSSTTCSDPVRHALKMTRMTCTSAIS